MEMNVNANRLFLASRIALIVTAMSFAIRGGLLGDADFRAEFNLSEAEYGLAFAPAFWGFTLAMIFGGPLCDILGMGRLLWFAFAGHVLGIILTIFSAPLGGFYPLFISTLLVGVGNGLVEAACNPLVATLYPDKKVEKLNAFHVWFPGGIVIGSIVVALFREIGLGWKIHMLTMLIPAAIYAYLFWKQKFPETERVAMGVSTGDMFKECVKPLFIFMVLCMFLTAATELGTNQWIDALLQGAGVSGILVLAFINGIMAIGRTFAGQVVHRLSTTGMLLFSAIFSAIGLFWLSSASGMTAFVAAGIFAVGICFFWPTMLGFVSEYMPKTGALGLAIMGGAGMFSVSIVLPIMGSVFGEMGGQTAMLYTSFLPMILIVAFGALHAVYRKKAPESLASASH